MNNPTSNGKIPRIPVNPTEKMVCAMIGQPVARKHLTHMSETGVPCPGCWALTTCHYRARGPIDNETYIPVYDDHDLGPQWARWSAATGIALNMQMARSVLAELTHPRPHTDRTRLIESYRQYIAQMRWWNDWERSNRYRWRKRSPLVSTAERLFGSPVAVRPATGPAPAVDTAPTPT